MMLIIASASGQTATQAGNDVIRALCTEVDPAGWLYFRQDISVSAERFWEVYGEAMGLSLLDEMHIQPSFEYDELGYAHTVFNQYYQTLEVEGAQYTLHSQDDRLIAAHGKIVEGLHIDPKARITAAEALRQALTSIGAERYAWEDEDWEKDIQIESGDSLASWYPRGELLVAFVRGDQLIEENYRLCWRFEVRALQPASSLAVYVDAHTGEVLKQRSLIHTCGGVAGTLNPLYNSNLSPEPFAIRHRGFPYNDYVLEDCGKGQGIETRVTQFKSSGIVKSWSNINQVTHNSTSWGTHQRTATSAHWALEESWDCFKNTFGQQGYDNQGKKVRALVEFQQDVLTPFENAAFDGGGAYELDILVFGESPDSADDLVSLDIVGHEFTHGITKYMAGLVYEREPGALNESFSDIFGTMVERCVEGSGFNWTIGEDAWELRNMEAPLLLLQPAQVGGTFWFDPSVAACPVPAQGPGGNDFCGVHINSGVQNRWFFLLSQGGLQNGVNVSGIGIDKASRIAWRNLIVYMQAQSNFADARNGAIQAAIDLYGLCSNEVAQVRNAWAAVNVGAANVLCVNITGPTGGCTDDEVQLVFTAKTTVGATCTWSGIPAGWQSTLSGPGNHTLTLTPGSTPVTANLGVSVSLAGQSANDAHTFVLSNCPQRLAAPVLPGVKIYPQPAGNSLQVEAPAEWLPARVEIYDLSGRQVLTHDLDEPQEEITLPLPSGYYYLRIHHAAHTSTRALHILKP